MADSLDDFFAKKDKKRNKDKGKTVFSAEALVRELEVGAKQVEYPSRKENKTSTAIELLGLDADDADWRDFEDVEKRDYSGLKVKEMSLQDQNDEEQRRLTSEQSELLPESTPWKHKDDEPAASSAKQKTTLATATATNTNNNNNKDDNTASEAPNPSPSEPTSSSSTKSSTEPKVDEKKEESSADAAGAADTKKSGDKESAKPKVYVPPGQRNAASGEMKTLEPIRLSKTKASSGGHSGAIPNIQDEALFPSLG